VHTTGVSLRVSSFGRGPDHANAAARGVAPPAAASRALLGLVEGRVACWSLLLAVAYEVAARAATRTHAGGKARAPAALQVCGDPEPYFGRGPGTVGFAALHDALGVLA